MILFKTSLHLFYAESASAIDWDLSTGEEGGVQMKWRKNINCNEVRKLSSTLINEWETFDCRYWLNVQFKQCLQGMIDLYWETDENNVKQLIAVRCDT